VRALPIAPSIAPLLVAMGIRPHPARSSRRLGGLCVLSAGVATLAAIAAEILVRLIAVITNVCWNGHWSSVPAEPNPHRMGWWTLLIPIAGGLIVGLMARFGAPGIRGHGIPEAMEQTLTKRGCIPPRMIVLKPLSAALAIGTGGPFGAEGPIIATGGALGSLLGQMLRVSANERRTLLAAGAAAGMAAIFGTPIAAVLLAVELLLFEFQARSFLPVVVAAAIATALRTYITGGMVAFPISGTAITTAGNLPGVAILGLTAGICAAALTRVVYVIEDVFGRLRLHWMWWPAIGGIAVGIAGLAEPRAIGIGYGNLTDLADGHLIGLGVMGLLVWKAFAWSIALGSGTSGGTLAPLLTIGGCLGACTATWLHLPLPVAVLVGMAAVFAGASHAVLTSAIFVAEATGQSAVAGSALCACAIAWLVASRMIGSSIMVEKILRRGVRVPGHQGDPLPRDRERIERAIIRMPRFWRRRGSP
jgi:chloride channel protein, CIC family